MSCNLTLLASVLLSQCVPGTFIKQAQIPECSLFLGSPESLTAQNSLAQSTGWEQHYPTAPDPVLMGPVNEEVRRERAPSKFSHSILCDW